MDFAPSGGANQNIHQERRDRVPPEQFLELPVGTALVYYKPGSPRGRSRAKVIEVDFMRTHP